MPYEWSERNVQRRSSVLRMGRRDRAVVGLAAAAAIGATWWEGDAALFAWIVGSGLGVPPGEDSLVARTGARVASGELAWEVAIPMAIVAVVISDVLLFTGGQAARAAVGGKTRWWPERAVHCIESLVGRWDALAIAVARFVPGVRTLVFVSVAVRGMSRGRFVVVDACAAAVWVPLVMAGGAAIVKFFFGNDASSSGG